MIRNPSCLFGYGSFVKCGLHPYCLYLRRPQMRASPSVSHSRAAGPHHQRETFLAIYAELFRFRLRKKQIRFPSMPSIWNLNWKLSGYQKILVSLTDISNPSANSCVCPSPKGSLLSMLAVFNVWWHHSLLSCKEIYARNVFIQLYGECMWAERFPVPLTKPLLIPDRHCFIPTNIFIFSSFKDSQANNLKESHAYHALLLCALERRIWMLKFDMRLLKENRGAKEERYTSWSASWAATQCSPRGQTVEAVEELCGWRRWNPHQLFHFWSISFPSCTCYSHGTQWESWSSATARTKSLFSSLLSALRRVKLPERHVITLSVIGGVQAVVLIS